MSPRPIIVCHETTDNLYLADLAILPFSLNGQENCYLGKMPILTKSPNRFIKGKNRPYLAHGIYKDLTIQFDSIS